MNVDDSDRNDAVARRDRRMRRTVGMTIFLCLVGIGIGSIVHYRSQRLTLVAELNDLELRRAELQGMLLQRERASKKAAIDKKVIWSLLRQCPSAEDIPDFQGEHLLAVVQNGVQKVTFYVPPGLDQLRIETDWKSRPKQLPSGGTGRTGPVGNKSWDVKLVSPGGYLMTVVADKVTKAVHWELTSNVEGFETVRKEIPLDQFVQQGTSWSGGQVAFVPLHLRKSASLERARANQSKSDSGIRLLDGTLNGRRLDTPFEIKIQVRVSHAVPS